MGEVNIRYAWVVFCSTDQLSNTVYLVLMHFRLHCPGRGEARGWPWPHRQAGRGLRALVPCLGFDSPGALGGGRGPARHCVPHLGMFVADPRHCPEAAAADHLPGGQGWPARCGRGYPSGFAER